MTSATDNLTTELREAAVICNLAGEHETARLLREAVYTIESLRDRLQAAMLEERKDVWGTSEEIVRCRNCKHYYEAENYHPNGNYVSRCCKYFDTYNDEVEPDGFCAWGKRKEDF